LVKKVNSTEVKRRSRLYFTLVEILDFYWWAGLPRISYYIPKLIYILLKLCRKRPTEIYP